MKNLFQLIFASLDHGRVVAHHSGFKLQLGALHEIIVIKTVMY